MRFIGVHSIGFAPRSFENSTRQRYVCCVAAECIKLSQLLIVVTELYKQIIAAFYTLIEHCVV